MNDDWRLQIVFREDGIVDGLIDHLDAAELEHDLGQAFHDRVIVSRNGTTLFLYAGDREQAERARALVEAWAEREREELTIELTRWHQLALEWKPADQPLPEDEAARVAEHQARVARERQEVERQGYPEYEVRIDLASHALAEEFAERLRGEGLPTVQRWKYVIVGATDQDQANLLAERIRGEAPAGSEVAVEGSWAEIQDEMPPNPFAFLGGLGG